MTVPDDAHGIRREPGGGDAFGDDPRRRLDRHLDEVRVALERELAGRAHGVGARAREAGEGAALLGGSAALALVALVALLALALVWVRRVLSPGATAGLVAAVAGGGALLLGHRGLALLRSARGTAAGTGAGAGGDAAGNGSAGR